MSLIMDCSHWLREHVDAMLTGDPALDETLIRKRDHCFRVHRHVRALLDTVDIAPDVAVAAELAGLLHDLGRFRQLVAHGTFDDALSMNHGQVGARLLMGLPLLAPLTNAQKKLVVLATNYHNRNAVPANIDGEARRVLDMLRDADKLDVLEINLGHLRPDAPHSKVLKAGLAWDDLAVSEHVLTLAEERKIIPFEAIHWSNDFVLFLACWIYDLNHPWTAAEILRRKTMTRLLEKLPMIPKITALKTRFWDDLRNFSEKGHF